MDVRFTPSARVQFLNAIETIQRNNRAAARKFRAAGGKRPQAAYSLPQFRRGRRGVSGTPLSGSLRQALPVLLSRTRRSRVDRRRLARCPDARRSRGFIIWKHARVLGSSRLPAGEAPDGRPRLCIWGLALRAATPGTLILGEPGSDFRPVPEGASRRPMWVNSDFRGRFDVEPDFPLRYQSLDPFSETARWTPPRPPTRPTRR